jgi:hypothetical protein
VDAGVDLPTSEPTNGGLVERSCLGEGGDERSANAGPICAHNRDPYQASGFGLQASGFRLR